MPAAYSLYAFCPKNQQKFQHISEYMRFLSLFRDSAAERAENCIFSHTHKSARLQRALSRYNRIQIIPPVFSLMIRESVCLNFIRTSSGMRLILVLSPSLTSS